MKRDAILFFENQNRFAGIKLKKMIRRSQPDYAASDDDDISRFHEAAPDDSLRLFSGHERDFRRGFVDQIVRPAILATYKSGSPFIAEEFDIAVFRVLIIGDPAALNSFDHLTDAFFDAPPRLEPQRVSYLVEADFFDVLV